MRVLYLVDHEDGMRMRTLTRTLGASPPSVSRLVDRLEALGFLERRPSPDSRREVMLCVTSSGRQHLTSIRHRRDELLFQALAGMAGPQRVALSEGLAGLQQAVTHHPMLRHVARDVPPAPPRM
ncbi:MarR family transcriptional regulator [Streptomyces sp. NPDC048674]|uniref:MarR family winged helix-turn-helix transcriptional regulator n=1 Tax=Streptomyces sp. NPDC048674 TaxID=3155491 RepID=UPI003430FBB4